MKKLLLIACVAIFSAANVQAQCSPDPQYTSPGIYPDSATNFAPACVNQPYTQLITNVVPADTSVLILGFPTTVPIDSIVLTSVSNLPPGMTISCNPSGCAYPGGTIGCAIISGTCATVGTYYPVFNLTAYPGGVGAIGGPQTFTINYYKIDVNACAAGIEENTSNLFKLFPNPTNNKAVIEGLTGQNTVSIANAEGKIIKTYAVTEGTSLEMNLEGLNNGLYFITVAYEKGTEVLKLIKE